MLVPKKLLWVLLIVVYMGLALFGVLSGMFSEGLIGSTHPMADLLADAMMWLGLIISLAAVACPVMAMRMKKQSLWRGVLLALPFMLLAAQLVLNAAAKKL